MQILTICFLNFCNLYPIYTYKGPINDISLEPPQLLRQPCICTALFIRVSSDLWWCHFLPIPHLGFPIDFRIE